MAKLIGTSLALSAESTTRTQSQFRLCWALSATNIDHHQQMPPFLFARGNCLPTYTQFSFFSFCIFHFFLGFGLQVSGGRIYIYINIFYFFFSVGLWMCACICVWMCECGCVCVYICV